MSENEGDRYSRVLEPYIIHDEDDRAYAEAKNALIQFDHTVALAEQWIRESEFKLRPSHILQLNRLALADIHKSAGTYRSGNMEIVGSNHNPVAANDVPLEIESLCDYININWNKKSAIHLAAYTLWRLNWIHPFEDGNGRTSRALSYLVLCAKLGFTLPGLNTVPDQISSNKTPYYKALEAADQNFESGKLDVSAMEELLKDRFANQLLSIYQRADPASARATAAHASGVSKTNENDTEKRGIVGTIESHPVLATTIVAILIAVITIVFS